MALFELLRTSQPLLLTVTALFGLLIGSFLNVVIYRLPRILERQWARQCQELTGTSEEPPQEPPLSLALPRSQCPHCSHTITALENIPILSYLILRGRCSACGTSISPRYPLIEGLTALVSVLVVWQFGFHPQALAVLLFSWALLALTVIDLDRQLLPDNITLPLLWLGLLVSLAEWFTDPASAIIGATAGYLSLWALYKVHHALTGREGMGYGDFKLLAALGAWMGWQSLPLVILLSSLVGAIVGIALMLVLGRDRNIPIPFGPYLAAAGWLALVWSGPFHTLQTRIFGL